MPADPALQDDSSETYMTLFGCNAGMNLRRTRMPAERPTPQVAELAVATGNQPVYGSSERRQAAD